MYIVKCNCKVNPKLKSNCKILNCIVIVTQNPESESRQTLQKIINFKK